ncbi:MAG: TetR/AcrR family transcriptional regulator [Pseudomonadota bacterium]
MPRPALTEQQRQQIRRKIRAAAAEIFAEVESGQITARALAERAGVSVGTVYAHFGNLNEVFQSLWRRPAGRLVVDLKEISTTREDPSVKLRRMLQSYVDFANSHASVFRNAFLYVRPEHQTPPPQVALQDDQFFQLFRGVVAAGQDEGLFRPGDPDTITQTVLSAVHGALALPINWHRLALDDSKTLPVQMIDAMLEWLASR